jgi:hypothetical protein
LAIESGRRRKKDKPPSPIIEGCELVKTAPEKYQRSKIITISNVIGIIMLFIFILGKLFLPQSEQISNIPSLLDSVTLLVTGLSISVSMAQYGYQAWLLDLYNFTEWYSYQQFIPHTGFEDWYNGFPRWNLRSHYQLLGPMGSLVGIVMAILGLLMTASIL